MEIRKWIYPYGHGLPSPSGDTTIDPVCNKPPVRTSHRTCCHLEVLRKPWYRAWAYAGHDRVQGRIREERDRG